MANTENAKIAKERRKKREDKRKLKLVARRDKHIQIEKGKKAERIIKYKQKNGTNNSRTKRPDNQGTLSGDGKKGRVADIQKQRPGTLCKDATSTT